MKHNTITILFYISLVIGLVGGPLVFIWWIRKKWRKLAESDLSSIMVRVLFYSFPGIIMFVALCIPALYFGNLLKQEDHCKQIIEVNKGIKKDDPFIMERCSSLDIDELFKNQSQ